MDESLSKLEQKREDLYRQLQETGDFRRGTISVNYRKCGKKNCACAIEGNQGHGPQYLWNGTINGKSYAKSVKLGPELEEYLKDIANHKRFQKLCDEIVEVNERICEMRPIRVVEDADELDALKKKLQQIFVAKYKKK
jgi:uncharacterized protein YdcH (DUF465 family)